MREGSKLEEEGFEPPNRVHNVFFSGSRAALFGLSAEGAALGQTSAATSGLAENVGAVTAENDGLGVAENSGDVVATRALNVHEIRVGGLYEALLLVGDGVVLSARVQEILLNKRHCVV